MDFTKMGISEIINLSDEDLVEAYEVYSAGKRYYEAVDGAQWERERQERNENYNRLRMSELEIEKRNLKIQ